MTKTSSTGDKIIGIIFGFLSINLSLFVYSYIQTYNLKYASLIILFLITFVVFFVATLFNNGFVKKYFWIGIMLSVFGSWICADFYKQILVLKKYEKNAETALAISPDTKLATKDSVFSFRNHKTNEKFVGIDTVLIEKGKKEIFMAFPIVDKDWGTTDSIIYWGCFKVEKMLFAKKPADYIEAIESQKSIGFEIKNNIEKRLYSDALRKSIYKNNLKINEHFRVVEMFDFTYEKKFWNMRIWGTVIVFNLLWLLMIFAKNSNPISENED